MPSQSPRNWLERSGVIPTWRTLHRPTLDPTANAVLRAPAIVLPEVQVITENAGSPDRAGTSEVWPNQELRSVP